MVRLLLVHGASFLHISNKGVYYSMWAEGMIQNGESLDCVAVNSFFSWNIMDNQYRCSVSQIVSRKKNYIIKLLNEQNNKCGLAVETDRYCFMSMTKPLETTEAILKLINLIIQKKNCKPRLPSWSFSTTPQEGALRGSWELRATSSFRDKSARSSDRMR